MGYDSSAEQVSKLLSRQKSNRLWEGVEKMISIHDGDVFCLPGLGYSSKESRLADWHAAIGREGTDDVFEQVKVLTSQISDMNDLALLLEKDAKRTQGVGSVDCGLIGEWEVYRGKLVDAKFPIQQTSLDMVKVGRVVLWASTELRVRGQAYSCVKGAQTAREAANAKVTEVNASVDEAAELCR